MADSWDIESEVGVVKVDKPSVIVDDRSVSLDDIASVPDVVVDLCFSFFVLCFDLSVVDDISSDVSAEGVGFASVFVR